MALRDSGVDSIAVNAEGAIAFTRALVRVPSTNDPRLGRSEQEAARLVADLMRSWGWQPEVSEAAPGRPNVVAVVDGGGGPGPTVLFEGHTDVVTEGALDTWTVDPFGAEITGGRLYGRGAADMKSGVAAMLYGVRALQETGPFPGRVIVAALADEEGLMLGVHHFVDSGLAAGVDGAIVCEPEEGEVCPVSKGALRLRIDLHGRMAHGAMPQHARNPVAVLGPLLTSLRGYDAELRQAGGSHEHLGPVYLTPTVVDAGTQEQMNVIPAHAAVCVDVRTIPGTDHKAITDRVAALARAAAEPDEVSAEVSVLVDRPPVDTPAEDGVVRALAAAHQEVTGEPPRYGGVPGTTDGTVLTHHGGVPSVVYGPGGKWIAHQADEYVEVDDIARCARVYATAARTFLCDTDRYRSE
ncbi:MAG: M20 family metallopeptidase [Streptosporangiales bacterium]